MRRLHRILTKEERLAAEKAEEEIVHVPKIVEVPVQKQVQVPMIAQVHWNQAQAEMVVEVPVPMIQEEMVVEVPVAMIQKELFHAVVLGTPIPKAPKRRLVPLSYEGFAAKVVAATPQVFAGNYK